MDQTETYHQPIKALIWSMRLQAYGWLKNKAIIQTMVWVIFAGIFFLGISGGETMEKSLLVLLCFFIPSIPAVYLHFYLFHKLLYQKKYLIYALSVVAIVFFFGLSIEWMAKNLIYYDDPSSYISAKFGVLTFLVVSTGFKFLFEGLQAKSKLAEIEAKQAKAELESLKSQVNPHFLFNSLNNIYGLLMQDTTKAGDSLLTLSSLLRYLIYASQKTQISLEEEVKFLEDYMAMERLRLGDKCQLSFSKEGNCSGKMLSPFLLIPFVENAFKHGSFATVGDSFINVALHAEEDEITFTVENSTNSDKQTATGGVGIANVRRRLELILPDKHELTVTRQKDRFFVKLAISL